MRRSKSCIVALFVAGAFSGGAAWADEFIKVDVTVSPSMIVLGLDKGASVTVHTDIALSVVDCNSVQLSGVSAYLTKADCRGNLVGKFTQAEIEALLTPGAVTMVLTGVTVDGTAFQGSDTVYVMIDPSPASAHMDASSRLSQANSNQYLAQSSLSDVEIGHIVFMREEEKLARDVYLAMYDLWGLRIFDNISQSEQRHMDAIGQLIEIYGLVDPVVDDTPGVFVNVDLASLYAQLIAQGTASMIGALSAGALIEDIDIVDLRSALEVVTHSNVQQVFENLESASCNHLRAFVGWLDSLGEVYTPRYLTQAEFDAIMDQTGHNGSGITRTPQRIQWAEQIRHEEFSNGQE